MMMDQEDRFVRLSQWLREDLGIVFSKLVPASSDASFRRYFRLMTNDGPYVVMDAPPGREDSRPFIEIAKTLKRYGLHVPEVFASDLDNGFLLLTDMGETDYLSMLNSDNADRMYKSAIDSLITMQSAGSSQGLILPKYDQDLLLSEMALFRDWLLQKHLAVHLTDSESRDLEITFNLLIKNALEQPQVLVHRDYHSRNLMLSEESGPGILDFQDALIGPISYDLVSLLRDCYISWPQNRQEDWVEYYCQNAVEQQLIAENEIIRFIKWFNLMGVQRHLKASGIFARLYHRDGKSGYLNDIPRTLTYITVVADQYPELKPLSDLLERRVLPRLAA